MTRCRRCGTALENCKQVHARRRDGSLVIFCSRCYSILCAKHRELLAMRAEHGTENEANQPGLWPYIGCGLTIITVAAFIYIRLSTGESQAIGL